MQPNDVLSTGPLRHLSRKRTEVIRQHEKIFTHNTGAGAVRMTRGPRPHRALSDAIPIAKARGLIQMAMGGPERIYDLSIVSKIPITFASVAFAPKILASVPELVEYYKNDLARLRVIARDVTIIRELWIRSRHGTWRFFQITPDTLVEIDREGNRIDLGKTVEYLADVATREQAGGTPPSS